MGRSGVGPIFRDITYGDCTDWSWNLSTGEREPKKLRINAPRIGIIWLTVAILPQSFDVRLRFTPPSSIGQFISQLMSYSDESKK